MTRAYILFHGVVCFVICLGISVTGQAQEEQPDDQAQGLVTMVLGLLSDDDKDMRALGLEQIRTQLPGQAITTQLASQLPRLSPPVQAELISALTDRDDPAARPAIVELLSSSDEETVRLAGLRALGFLGTEDDVPLLIRFLSDGTSAEQSMARSSLNRLPGASVSRAIISEMNRAEPTLRIALMETLVARHATLAANDLLTHALDRNREVRSAAMQALGQLAGPEQVAGMVQGILAAEEGRERDAAEKCVMLVCHRIEDPSWQAAPLWEAMRALPAGKRLLLLPALGRVGGPIALRMMNELITSSNPTLHQAGVRALCNWPNASVTPELLQIVQTDVNAGCRTAALRALIRVAPLPDGRSDAEKLQLLKTVWPLCQRDQERTLVLRRASAIRIPETLEFLLPFLDQPDFAQQASQSIVELAHHRGLRDANKTEFSRALEKVKQVSRDATVIDRANRYLKGQTWTGR